MYEHKPYVECLYTSLILSRRRSFRAPFQLICSYMYKIPTWISNLCLQKPSVCILTLLKKERIQLCIWVVQICRSANDVSLGSHWNVTFFTTFFKKKKVIGWFNNRKRFLSCGIVTFGYSEHVSVTIPTCLTLSVFWSWMKTSPLFAFMYTKFPCDCFTRSLFWSLPFVSLWLFSCVHTWRHCFP